MATGSVVAGALEAARILRDGPGVSCAVMDMATLRPLDVDAVREHMRGKRLVATVEEHVAAGGLGSALLEGLCGVPHPPFELIACPPRYPHAAAYAHLVEEAGLSARGIASSIARALGVAEAPRGEGAGR